MKRLILLLFIALHLVSCIETTPSTGGRRSGSKEGSSESTRGPTNTPSSGSSATDSDTTSTSNLKGIPELRHLVDPIDLTYKTKVTIPKNLSGNLYVSGLNVTSLRDKFVKVRFKFGRSKEPITIDATVSRAPGIIPQTDIEVLILDLSSKPFKNLRLPYDLYDYNTYNTSSDPVVDPRDGGLFCRGLDLEDDPTFNGTLTTGCSESSHVCKYAYAKVLDSGLYFSGLALLPTEPQIDISKNGYGSDSSTVALKKCLPDTSDAATINGVLFSTPGFTASTGTYGEAITLGTSTYNYFGPFRTANKADWKISSNAIFSTSGIFASQLTGAAGANGGFNSYLFPRAGTMELQAGVDHFASATNTYIPTLQPIITRSETPMLAAGETQYMDGCNLRVTNFDSFLNEGIGSCNVTSTIEIISVDPVSGDEEVQTVSSKLKLQLIKASLKDNFGKEILSSSMKSCSSSSSCSASECCFNERCWGKDLVSQCIEDVSSADNLIVGESCSNDFQCASLCCNPQSSKCAVHDNTVDPPVLCSKPAGQSCVSKEWCNKETVQECKVTKTGTDAQGNTTCTLRCYYRQVFGDCVNGKCQMPQSPAVPAFNPTNPDCSNAVDPE